MAKNRKSLLIKILPLALGLSLNFGCNYLNQSASKQNISRTYWNLQETDIPGVRKIERYGEEDSEHLIVDVRQMHFAPNGKVKDLAELTAIKQVQDDIYDSLSYFMDNFKLKQIYVEGLHSKKSKQNFNTFYSFDRLHLERGLKQTPAEDAKEYSEGLGILTEAMIIRERVELTKPDSIERFLYVFLLKSLNERAQKELYEDREDALLKIVDGNGDKLAVTVYGAGHDFRDNVEKWNQENPKNRFALMTLTPWGYKEEK